MTAEARRLRAYIEANRKHPLPLSGTRDDTLALSELEQDLIVEGTALIEMVRHEVGVRWMTMELRLQLEKVELILVELADPPPC